MGRTPSSGLRTLDALRSTHYALSTTHYPLILCASALVALAVSVSAQAPAPPERFRSGVDLVTVDAVVVDKNGHPVEGLTRADFTVYEDGKAQQLTDFEAVATEAPVLDPAAAPPPAPHPPVSTNVGQRFASATGRTFAVVFDDLNLTRAQGDQARRATKDFLETAASPDDTITFVTTSGVAWLNAKMPQDRDRLLAVMSRVEGKYVPDHSTEHMSDYEAMRIHQYQDTLVEAQVRRRYEYNRVAGYEPKRPQDQNDNAKVGEMPGNYGIIESEISSRAEEVYATHEARNRQTLKLLERAVDALRTARGRKAVVLLSKGFIYDTELRGFKDVSRAAREANVAIYFIDARGLETGPSQFSAESVGPTDPRDIGPAIAGLHYESAGAASVAEDSGGFSVENTNDLSAGFRRIAARVAALLPPGVRVGQRETGWEVPQDRGEAVTPRSESARAPRLLRARGRGESGGGARRARSRRAAGPRCAARNRRHPAPHHGARLRGAARRHRQGHARRRNRRAPVRVQDRAREDDRRARVRGRRDQSRDRRGREVRTERRDEPPARDAAHAGEDVVPGRRTPSSSRRGRTRRASRCATATAATSAA